MRPQKDDIGHLDFHLTCAAPRAVTRGTPCTAPALYYTETHATGACFHPSLNKEGNFERFLCATHLQALEAEAERVARQHAPLPFWLRWFREDPNQRCRTCHKPICHPGDVLQCVVHLPEGNTA